MGTLSPEETCVSDEKLSPRDIEVLEQVGDGVTSIVYRGLYKGREVAIKEMLCDTQRMSSKARLNLQRELMILKKVKHPNLVNFVGVLDEDTKVRIITDFCGGGVAFDLLHNSGLLLSWEQKLQILYDVAIAMEYLHSNDPPIVHRDLKSLNLLLEQEVETTEDVPIVKVTDFGLARMISAAGGGVMTKESGTFHWMAPEVFVGNSYGTMVDVYSYSMIMYEVICQDIPFYEVAGNRLGLLVTKGRRPELMTIPSDCPQYVFELMVECWAQDPSVRPPFPEIVEVIRG